MTTYSFHLPKFAGSTLEPTVAPVVAMPPPSGLKSPMLSTSPANSVSSASSVASQMSSFSLNRPNRPTFIHLPDSCTSFTMNKSFEDDWSSYDPQERGCTSGPQFQWDENTQSILKAQDQPLSPSSSRHIFWSA